jgi:folate-binding protein YgfZ
MAQNRLSSEQLDNFAEIPTDFLCALPSYHGIHVSGPDTTTYLQGQLTADIEQLSSQQALRTCLCDAKGKTIHIGLLSSWQSGVLLMGHLDSSHQALSSLRKFGVFAKADITDTQDSLSFFAGQGQQLIKIIEQIFAGTPNNTFEQIETTLGGVIKLEGQDRFLFWLQKDDVSKTLDYSGQLSDESIWQASEIYHGIPELREATHSQFVPQMMNLQVLNAISFTKGCYLGQETVARTKYLGRNKRALYILSTPNNVQIDIGASLKFKTDDYWKKAGNVLRWVSAKNQTLIVAILPSTFQPGSHLYVDDTVFEIQPLPYSIDE